MLIEFRIKNFRSFCDEQVFSMVASSDKSLIDNSSIVEKFGGKRLLNSAAIYGANASGKSNFIMAIDAVKILVCGSADTSPGMSKTKIVPFLLDDRTSNEPSEFEIAFMHNDVRYQYGFILDEEKVYSEWLIAYPHNLPQKWYERKLDLSSGEYNWYFGPKLKGDKVNLVSLTRQDVLFLSVAAKFNHQQLTKVYQWFQKKLIVYSDIRIFDVLEKQTARYLRNTPEIHHEVTKILQIADLGITNFRVEEKKYDETKIPSDMPEELRSLLYGIKISMQHTGTDQNKKYVFPITRESNGTRRYFGLSGLWLSVLKNGTTLVFDELDSSLHPILVRALVEMFNNPESNKNGSQLIFNTHDTTLLDQSLFRRDQVWFTEKDIKGQSQIYSLLEYSPRKDESLSKGYLQGRYGAIPFLGSFSWGELDGEE